MEWEPPGATRKTSPAVRVDTASGFQVKYLHIVMKMLVTHGEAWYTNLPFNVNSIIIFLCIHAVSFPIKN